MALADALTSLSKDGGFEVVAAHLDHGLRPDSGDDVVFCEGICERLGIPLRAGRADVSARARRDGGGLEEAGRLERYAFLRAVKREAGASWVAVAHTRDDQAETVLLRLLRGAGSRGLGAMRLRSADLLRPLLEVSREQVLDHLRQRGLPWREDPTNADRALMRNRVRHELLPFVEDRFNPRVRAALARSAALLGEEADTLDSLAETLLNSASRWSAGSLVLRRQALAAAPLAVARATLRRAVEATGGLKAVSKLHVDRMLALVNAKDPSRRRLALPGGREAVFSFREIAFGRHDEALAGAGRATEARP